MVELDPLIRAFYRDRYVEDDRLARSGHGRLEFLRTQELLRRWLPPASVVLDVGGATGVHARWLAADGHHVTLVDPVDEHVRQAATIGAFEAVAGDARHLDQPDASVDVTLLLGPLYHLVEATDRAQALSEAARVTRPGGLVVAAGINRYAGLLECGSSGGLTETIERDCLQAFESGRGYDNPNGFTNAYFHHPEELTGEFAAAGLADIEILGVEGPAITVLHLATPEEADALLPSAVRLAGLLEADPRLISASFHFLARGTVG
jgi:ubiquinone/menaquinone biosynthesis C-methylase UbiE